MARRRSEPADDPPTIPGWVTTFVPADWTDPADETSALAEEWGPAMARTVLAHHRRSEARRAWAAEHGLSLRDLGRQRLARHR